MMRRLLNALISPFGVVVVLLFALSTLLTFVFWLALGFNSRIEQNLTSRSDQIVWNIFQVEADYLRLLLAAEAHLDSVFKPNPDIAGTFLNLKQNFDLFYSRVDTFAISAKREIKDPQYLQRTELLQMKIVSLADEFDATPIDGWPEWQFLVDEIQKDKEIVRQLVVDGLQHIVVEEAEQRVLNLRLWQEYRQQLTYILGLVVLAIGAALYVTRSLYVRMKLTETTVADLKSASQKLKKMAVVDPLTNLYTRRAFKQIANAYDGQDALVIWLDIDDFKSVNDTWGHKTGDELLQTIACSLQKCTGEASYVLRLGGEEFGLVTPWYGKQNALEFSYLICAEVSRSTVEVEGTYLHRTASLGLAYRPSNVPIEAALEIADRAMFLAKERGKNQIAFIEDNFVRIS